MVAMLFKIVANLLEDKRRLSANFQWVRQAEGRRHSRRKDRKCCNAQHDGADGRGLSMRLKEPGKPKAPGRVPAPTRHSTVTLFARLRGWSTSVPLATAT